MRPGLILLFVVTCCSFASAQTPDSTRVNYDSLLQKNASRLDTTVDRINGRIDGVQSRINGILNPDLNKITSRFRKKNTGSVDTLKAAHELDSLRSGLSHRIDSLRSLNLPTDKYTQKLDSLKGLSPTKYIEQTEAKAREIQNRVNKPMTDATGKVESTINRAGDKINKPIDNLESKVNDKLDLMKQEGGDGANLPGGLNTKDLSVGNASLPGADLTKDLNLSDKINMPDTKLDVTNPVGKVDNPLGDQLNGGQLGEFNGKVADIKSVPQDQLNKLKATEGLQSVQEKAGSLNTATDKLQGYGDDAKKIASGDASEVKAIPDALENRVGKLDEMKELEKQTGERSVVKDMVGKGNDPEAMKGIVKEQVMQQAKDHFAGKQEALQAAMEKVAKLKSKYSEVSSIKDLPKRAPNPMKSKPLIERIVPGLTFQIQKQNNLLIDLNPVVSYRFTGRINGGFGWNERLSFSDWNKTVPIDRIFGPRVFGSFSFKKGFALKAEIEKMNAFIPPFALAPDAGHRAWVWSAFVGFKKDYRFMKSVNGNVQMLYNLYDDHDASPYTERLNVRMGFEFPMKKKQRPVAK